MVDAKKGLSDGLLRKFVDGVFGDGNSPIAIFTKIMFVSPIWMIKTLRVQQLWLKKTPIVLMVVGIPGFKVSFLFFSSKSDVFTLQDL